MSLQKRRSKMTAALCLLALLISCVTLAFGTVRVAAPETARVYVDPPLVADMAMVPGTLFTVNVKVDNVVADPGLVGAEFKLTYDPTILNVRVLEEVMFHTVTPLPEWDNIWQLQLLIDNTEGYVAYACTWQDLNLAYEGGYAPISGSQTIARIVFEVTSTGECLLSFSWNGHDSVILANPYAEAIPHESVDGYFSNIPPWTPELMVYVDPAVTDNSSLRVGSIFNVSVKMDSNILHQGVIGLQFNFTWDPAILEAVGMTEIMFNEVTPRSDSSNIWQIMHKINNTGGYLVYAYAFMDVKKAISGGYAPIAGNHTLAYIAFRVKDTATTGLNLTDCKAGDLYGNPLTCGTIDGVFKSSSVIPGDLNSDGIVDISDAILASRAYGSSFGDPNWNALADLDGNGIVDIFDMIRLAAMFGRAR